MLKVEHVTKYYGKNKAVDDLSFTVKEGEIFGLLGVNGAGKTTTFRMINGLLDLSSGSITMDGKPIDYTMTDRLGFLTEERSLLTKLTVKEQVLYYGVLKGMKEETILKRLDEWLDYFQISDYKERKIKELSKGNQQKVQFITAIINEPKLLILDEPFVGLDPKAAVILKDTMRAICAGGGAIFFSTHVLDVAQKLCNKVAIIKDGTLVASGNMEEIVKQGQSLESIFMEVVEHVEAN